MTPLIQEMVNLSPEVAIDFHWFDMSNSCREKVSVDVDVMSIPMPFPKTAIVRLQDDGIKVLALITQEKDVTMVASWLLGSKGYKKIKPFTYVVRDGQVLVAHEDGSKFDYKTSDATGLIAMIASFTLELQKEAITAYEPTKRANHEKKIRQGKMPTYDWKTILIEPPKPKGPDQGGTHASPRWHERRGHWRTVKSGKKVWVKNCEVGDKSKGAVFHDYQI